MSAAADALRSEIVRAARELGAPESFSPVLERPRDPSHGDWATNAAMLLAKPLGKKPREVAEALVGRLDLARAGATNAEIAGPGFINFRLDAGFLANGLKSILSERDDFGRAAAGKGTRVVVEFVSANPTGPLHVGHGRQAALGDAISALLEWSGWNVSREFYYNDAGVQIENLALSTWLRAAEHLGVALSLPKFAYHGDYIREIAQRVVDDRLASPESLRAGAAQILEAAGEMDALGEDDRAIGAVRARLVSALDRATFEALRRRAVEVLRGEQDLDLKAFGVRFDTYFLETSLYTDGKVDETVRRLESNGSAYEKDGALWLCTTRWGDDKDRVMRKRDGSYTYFVPDVAYHVTKYQRGFPRAINVQGADHHSTVTRVRAGLQALDMGIPAGYPDYVLHQMVTVMKGGEEVKISKRAGSYVTVRDLVDWVGRDGVRYFYLMRKGDSQLVFDVDLAVSQSEENPIYRIQMAHARMCGIFRVGEIDAATFPFETVDLAPLTEPAEQELIKALLDFPRTVAGAAESLEPHRIAGWLLETAGLAHAWYHKHHVLGEPEPVMHARLVLAHATRQVLRNGLAILGIAAPERM